MPERDVALELVQEDVTQGLTAWLEPQSNDHGFAVLRRDGDDLDHLLSSPFGDDVAVPWTWTGVHRGVDDNDDDRDVMGYQPTGKTIEVRGVTIVSDRDGDVTFARFVDWVSALAEIGIPLAAQPVVDVPTTVPDP